MATLVLTAVGTALGGPIGGSIGTLIGSQIDGALSKPSDREGPRLTELQVTTSSYGSPIGRHFGKMRVAGTIIWATDLKESRERSGGGKGSPSTVTYSYSSSFAVALASRPISRIGRIWADGNLLRGAADDLKVGGAMRLYTGTGDQQPDPLIAAAEGAQSSAFRGFAYCVFEDLQLADFGNRIPALTFEVFADEGEVSLAQLVAPAGSDIKVARTLSSLKGFSDNGGSLAENLSAIDRIYPLTSNTADDRLTIGDANPESEPELILPAPIVDQQGESFGGISGKSERFRADSSQVPAGLRYYDVERDYQAGLQRAGGKANAGRSRIIEFPGALYATSAKQLADGAAERAAWSQDRLAYRIAQIDPRLSPGQIVSVPHKPGKWRIDAWEWRENGLELELQRVPQRKSAAIATSPGRSLTPTDNVATPTVLHAFELPWNGAGYGDQRQVFAAASSSSSGWTGAALYADIKGSLSPIGETGSRRSITGKMIAPLPPGPSCIVDRETLLTVELLSQDFAVESRSLEDLAQGANRAVVGKEVIQFANVEHLGGSHWQLSHLLRGRGGTEHEAQLGAVIEAPFVLLDENPIAIDPAQLGDASAIAAIGLADADPLVASIASPGITQRPLAPVHPKAKIMQDGSLALQWIRRARGAWSWPADVEVPLAEQVESYEIGLGSPDLPLTRWQSPISSLTIEASAFNNLRAQYLGEPIWVRQIGTYARSLPLLLTTIH
ncbi:MAG: phage tail protein [Alteraurantiacibacter sp. bin_em_oilr2.035]|nr:phage tail protein [Alteraurantiacibacter sp. bin_em_oilr2.035]